MNPGHKGSVGGDLVLRDLVLHSQFSVVSADVVVRSRG